MSTVIAIGGGGFSDTGEATPLEAYALRATEQPRPRVLFVGTAGGDSDSYIVKFYRAFGRLPCVPSHLSLFRRDDRSLRESVLEQDVIYVGGGSVANLLALWKLHGLDELMAEAYRNGVVLAGVSAGALCWFTTG